MKLPFPDHATGMLGNWLIHEDGFGEFYREHRSEHVLKRPEDDLLDEQEWYEVLTGRVRTLISAFVLARAGETCPTCGATATELPWGVCPSCFDSDGHRDAKADIAETDDTDEENAA